MRHRVVIAGILAVLISAVSAQAGWLVLRTGVAFETVGGWKIQDNWLNFTDKKTGQRKAVMIATVDLDATREALLTDAPPKVEPHKATGPTVIDDKVVHSAGIKQEVRKQRPASEVAGRLSLMISCLNAFANNPKAFESCMKNVKL